MSFNHSNYHSRWKREAKERRKTKSAQKQIKEGALFFLRSSDAEKELFCLQPAKEQARLLHISMRKFDKFVENYTGKQSTTEYCLSVLPRKEADAYRRAIANNNNKK